MASERVERWAAGLRYDLGEPGSELAPVVALVAAVEVAVRMHEPHEQLDRCEMCDLGAALRAVLGEKP